MLHTDVICMLKKNLDSPTSVFILLLFKTALIACSWGQHGAHLGLTGPRWVPCWPHELCYLRVEYLSNQCSYSVQENHTTHRTFLMAGPICLMRDFKNLNRILKAHQTNVWWIMKVFQEHCSYASVNTESIFTEILKTASPIGRGVGVFMESKSDQWSTVIIAMLYMVGKSQ